MTLQLKPGHNLSDTELLELEALIEQHYPDEDILIVYEDEPQHGYASQQDHLPEKKPNLLTRLAVLVVTLLAGIYLLNPTAGVLEFIPDVIPVVGNLDEATALALLVSGLSFYGINIGWLTAIFGRGMGKRKRDD